MREPVRDWLAAGRALPPRLLAAAGPSPLAAEEGAGTVLSSGVAAPEAWLVSGSSRARGLSHRSSARLRQAGSVSGRPGTMAPERMGRGQRVGLQKRTLWSLLAPASVRTGNLTDVAEHARDKNNSRLTERGRATRGRILRAAADMMYVKGVSSTTLDEIRAASGTSKSQLYRHYPDKDALVRDVVALQAAELLERQHQQLQRLNSLRGLERWRDALIERNALRNGAYGCPLGSLASELADQDEEARKAIARHFDTWEGLLKAGLERMKDSGVLRADADAAELATSLMAALQGGYLLAQTAQDVKPMRIALDMAIGHVKAYAVPAEDGNPPEGGAGGR